MKRLLQIATMAALIAACGGGTTTTQTGAPTTQSGGATTMAGAGSTLAVSSTSLGDVLTVDGMTVYLLATDEQGAPTCTGSCAATWPAVTSEVTAGAGVDASLIGTVAGAEGGSQVTYNGWPIYFYGLDNAPGDVNGQGVSDVWFVISPAGEPVS